MLELRPLDIEVDSLRTRRIQLGASLFDIDSGSDSLIESIGRELQCLLEIGYRLIEQPFLLVQSPQLKIIKGELGMSSANWA